MSEPPTGVRRRTILAHLLAGGALMPFDRVAKRQRSQNVIETDRAQQTTTGAAGEWVLDFEDPFDGAGLANDTWEIGWGWGRNTLMSPTQIVPENVAVSDGTLQLTGTHDGETPHSGAVNTKNSVTFGPGSYCEARIRFAQRNGFQNAFWSKPNSEAWPPEIDVVELWQNNNDEGDAVHSHHHLHYSQSLIPGDDTTHENIGVSYEPGGDLTEQYHTYGVEWQADRITHYVDGVPIQDWTDTDMLVAMGAGAPFYLMFSLNINNIGMADMSESWGEQMIVDTVRLWHYVPDGTTDRSHYLWVRSTGDEPATFSFRATGGNVALDTEENRSTYWVSPDRTSGGGFVDRRDNMPGFWYDGQLLSFVSNGSLELYVDDTLVDHATLPSVNRPPPPPSL